LGTSTISVPTWVSMRLPLASHRVDAHDGLQQGQLPFAETGDIGEGVGTGENGQQR